MCTLEAAAWWSDAEVRHAGLAAGALIELREKVEIAAREGMLRRRRVCRRLMWGHWVGRSLPPHVVQGHHVGLRRVPRAPRRGERRRRLVRILFSRGLSIGGVLRVRRLL